MKILVAGAGGFIAGYLVKDLLTQGHEVIAADIKSDDMWYQTCDDAKNYADCDLGEKANCYELTKGVDRIYNLACNMGGMGFIQNNHALCMESVLIQTHMLMAARDNNVKEILYSSSACIYPLEIQCDIKDAASQGLKESDAYPANPEDGYGWEKLFSEIITRYFGQDFKIDSRVCRYHNVYGPYGTWRGGREKAPAAMCRKVIEAQMSGNQEIENIAGIKLKRNYNLDAPQGVRGRNSENTMIKEVLGWAPSVSLREGMEKTYAWIYDQMQNCSESEGY